VGVGARAATLGPIFSSGKVVPSFTASKFQALDSHTLPFFKFSIPYSIDRAALYIVCTAARPPYHIPVTEWNGFFPLFLLLIAARQDWPAILSMISKNAAPFRHILWSATTLSHLGGMTGAAPRVAFYWRVGRGGMSQHPPSIPGAVTIPKFGANLRAV